ncbi:unnamed protein product [Rangifer tarandus platyrhynchus]|uniref:Uncharacterized protein n=1 Tax=Rangifer tarandus platyrhynchus TaxID=3082113 RepID=A0AC59ZB31_RANTA
MISGLILSDRGQSDSSVLGGQRPPNNGATRSSVPQQRKHSGFNRLRKPPAHPQGSEPAPGKVALGAQHTRGTGDPRTRIPPSPPRRECATGRAGPRLLKGGLAATRNSRPYLFLAEKPVWRSCTIISLPRGPGIREQGSGGRGDQGRCVERDGGDRGA